MMKMYDEENNINIYQQPQRPRGTHRFKQDDPNTDKEQRPSPTAFARRITYALMIFGMILQISIYDYALISKNKLVNDAEQLATIAVNKGSAKAVPLPDISHFAFKIFTDLTVNHPPRENILLSPYSLAMALTLVLAGTEADSNCHNEIRSAFRLSRAQTHDDMAALRRLVTPKTTTMVTMSNSIWTKYSIRSDYKNMVKKIHDAEVKDLPPRLGPIDLWVGQKTNGLISNIGNDEPIDPRLEALLLSVLTFKGQWREPLFSPSETRVRGFQTPSGNKDGNFMHANRDMLLARNVQRLGGATMLRLDYAGGSVGDVVGRAEGRLRDGETIPETGAAFCALLILPRDNSEQSMAWAVRGLMPNLKSPILGGDTHAFTLHTEKILYQQNVRLAMPRFRVEWDAKSLRPMLDNIGIKAAFAPGGETGVFSLMSTDPDVHLSDVMHRAVMEVTEEGTTAAAASAARMKSRSLPGPAVGVTFDRPFLMMVMHIPTATPLFLAKINDPIFI